MADTRKIVRADDSKLRILAFGNSLTEGYTDFGMTFHPYGHALRDYLDEAFPDKEVTVDVNGQSGDFVLNSLGGNFEDRLRRALRTEQKPKYDLVVMLGGTNDLAHKLSSGMEGSREIFEAGLKPLYEHVLEREKSNLVVITVPERAIDTREGSLASRARDYRLELNRLIMEWAKDQEQREPKVFLFDLAPRVPFRENRDKDPEERIWSPDGLHMSQTGYDVFGIELAKFVKELV